MAKKQTEKAESKDEKPKSTGTRKTPARKSTTASKSKTNSRKTTTKKRTPQASKKRGATKTASASATERYYGVDPKTFFKPHSYSPEQWGEVFIAYLKDRKGSVWNKKEAIKSGDLAGKIIDIPTSLPLSIESFCVFAGVHRQTFYNYESGENYEEYFDITARMRDIIESDQLDGATIGAYNHQIIARRLGLMNKIDVTSKGKEIDQPQHVTFEIIKTQKTD